MIITKNNIFISILLRLHQFESKKLELVRAVSLHYLPIAPFSTNSSLVHAGSLKMKTVKVGGGLTQQQVL